jgi:MFS family permease
MPRWGRYMVDSRPLSIAAYRRLWLASLVTAVGGSFSLIAVPTLLFTLTGSSAYIGLSAVVAFVTLVVSALWGGAFADVVDRRRMLLATNAGLALTYALFWLHGVLGIGSITLLMVLVGIQGLSFGANMTTMGAAIPRIVSIELLPAANSLGSLVRQTGTIVGPLLAGVLIPLVGLNALFLFDTLALSMVLWAVYRLPSIPPTSPVVLRPTVGQLLDGFRYLFAQRVLVAVLAVDLSAMAFGMPIALFPELAERTFDGPRGGGFALGALYAAYPVGVFAMGLFSGTFTRASRHGALMASAAMAWGLAVVGFGLSPTLWLAFAFLVVGGAVNLMLSTFRNAITQSYTDDALRGRIQGSLTVVLVGGPQLANVLHGTAGAALGTTWAICGGGVLVVTAVMVILVAVPDLWKYTPQTETTRRGCAGGVEGT